MKNLQRLSTLIKIVLLFLLVHCNFANSTERFKSKNVTIGVFLVSIYDLDLNSGTYGADFWIWSESQIKSKFRLDSVELESLQGKYPLDISLKYQENLESSVSFENRKIRGTFLHDFNLDLFPFDKQVLRFSLEGTDSADEFNFLPSDLSGFSRSIKIQGWEVSGFKLSSREIMHGTNFGYAKYKSNVKYPSIVVEIEL